jgi:hypothetical protein
MRPEPSDGDLAAQILRERQAAVRSRRRRGTRRRAAASSPAQRRTGATLHGLACGLHQNDARGTGKPSGAARSTGTRRRRRVTRRGDDERRCIDGEPVPTTQGTGTAASSTGDFLTFLWFPDDLLGDGAAAMAEIDGGSRPRVSGFGGVGLGAARVSDKGPPGVRRRLYRALGCSLACGPC